MFGRVLVVVAVAALAACESSTEANITYGASLAGANERPNPVTSSGTGSFSATMDGSMLTYTVSYSGLSANSTGAHIHGPATTEQSANALVNLDAATAGRTIVLGALSGSGSGSLNLAAGGTITATVSTDSLRKLLDAGLLYVNVHSANNTGGEIRGQITRK